VARCRVRSVAVPLRVVPRESVAFGCVLRGSACPQMPLTRGCMVSGAEYGHRRPATARLRGGRGAGLSRGSGGEPPRSRATRSRPPPAGISGFGGGAV